MGGRTFIGDLSNPLSASQSNQINKCSSYLQSDRNFFDFGELHNDCTNYSYDHYNNQPEQGITVSVNWQKRMRIFFLWAGKCSLEIYMIHGLVLNIFKSSEPILFASMQGYVLTAGNFALTVGSCFCVIELLNQNLPLKKFLSIR